ncbi:MAG: tol-pal system YbgF family protein [Kofleriaceae bacterium]
MAAAVQLFTPARDAFADGGADQAAQAYERGKIEYQLQHFDKAAEHFEAAYRLSKSGNVLFNLAQCHRRIYERSHNLRSLNRALDLYEQFLAIGSPREDVRTLVTDAVAELRAALETESARAAQAVASAKGAEGIALARELIAQGAGDQAVAMIDRIIAVGNNDSATYRAALAARADAAIAVGQRVVAVATLEHELSLGVAIAPPDPSDPVAVESHEAAIKLFAGKQPLRLIHEPVVLEAGAPTITAQVANDRHSLVDYVTVHYRKGAGFAKAEGKPGQPVTLGIVLAAGDRLDYYFTAHDRHGNELLALGAVSAPFTIRIAAGRTLRRIGIGAALAGAVVGGVGAYYAVRAGHWEDETVAGLSPESPTFFNHAAYENGRRDRRISVVLLASGGVALVAGVALYMIGRQTSSVERPAASLALDIDAISGAPLVTWSRGF